MLERLIETDDWQEIHNPTPLSSVASSALGAEGDVLISLVTERQEGDADGYEGLSLAS